MHGPMRIADRAAFYAWADTQTHKRFERQNGEIIRMPAEVWGHVRLKMEIWRALDSALSGHADCRVIGDGMAVAVDDDTDYIPDATVHQGDPIPLDSQKIPNPIIVVEALSPSTQRIDTTVKVEGYLRVAHHYLIFRTDRREVLHWTRGATAAARPLREIRLDPPGIVLSLTDIYDRAELA